MMVLSDGGGVGSLPSSSSNASGVGATTDVRKQQRGRGEVAARSSSSSSSSSSVGSRRAVRVVAPTMVILATLLAANLLVLGVQVWRFLPPPSDRDDDDHHLRRRRRRRRHSRAVVVVDDHRRPLPPPPPPSPPPPPPPTASRTVAAPSFKATPEADDRATDATDDAVRGGRHKRRVRREEEEEEEEEEGDVRRRPRSSSSSSSFSFVRYDVVTDVLDRQRRGRGAYGAVHQLPSIPDRRRMVVAGGGRGGAPPPTGRRYYDVPPDAVRNLTYFLESRMRPDEEDRPLYVYNPMLLPLDPKILDVSILKDLCIIDTTTTTTNNEYIYDEYETTPAYVAVYRVSNFGNCHGAGRGVPETYRNYIGLALLDADLNIVRGKEEERREGDGGRMSRRRYSDVVIDLNQHLFDVRWSPRRRGGGAGLIPKAVKQYMQDCQLIAAPLPSSSSSSSSSSHESNNAKKADGLILICNEYAMRVRLERTATTTTAGGGGGGGAAGAGAHNDATGVTASMSFDNAYGSGLRLTALEMPNVIMMGGKNLHYFRADGTTSGVGNGGVGTAAAGTVGGDGDGYLEIWPGGPHETMRMDFANYDGPIVRSSEPEPGASFATVDGVPPPDRGGGGGRDVGAGPLTPRDSGSACCVSIRWRDDDDDDASGVGGGGGVGAGKKDGEGRRLLLGFSHRKTRRGLGRDSPQYNYVSRVYAFEPTPPFDVVARSGFFCLGFALGKRSDDALNGTSRMGVAGRSHAVRHLRDDEANESDNEQVWGAANDYKLKINGEVFDNCPAIHFVTGIADKMGDEEETAIVSYGVNDCYPRMIEVSKKFLVSLLKQPPKE